ncbi:hypothetical protein ES703_80269 [subsurface metagenome]
MFYPRLMPRNSAGIEARRVAGAMTSMRIDELITNLAKGIAAGQLELDKVCMEIAVFMGDAQIEFGKKPGTNEPDLLSLIELGFTPNFYQFVDTILEVRVAISSTYEETRAYDYSTTQAQNQELKRQNEYQNERNRSSSGLGFIFGGIGFGIGRTSASRSSDTSGSSSYKSTNLYVRTVDATYSSTYNYSVEGSSLIKTKILPIPPPTVLEEIIRAKLAQRREEIEYEQNLNYLTRQLPEIKSLAENLYIPPTTTNLTKSDANQLKDGITKISRKYYEITLEQWVIIANLEEREIADGALEVSNENVNKLLELFLPGEEDKVSDHNVGGSCLDAIRDNLKTTFIHSLEAMEEGLQPEPEVVPDTTAPEPGGD